LKTELSVLSQIELSDQPFMAREETSKYTETVKDGKIRQFTFDTDKINNDAEKT